ncbi:hypothetical protein GCM10028807_62890 [Spirosoma daeguense]
METNQNQHTPGPWFAVNYAGFLILQTEPFYGESDLLNESICKEAEANARLMAAAPDLLEQLKETHAALCFDPKYLGSHRYEQNREVIEKAQGFYFE